MGEVLGFEWFAAADGDWGSVVTWELGTRHVSQMVGGYLPFPPIWPAGGVDGLRPEQYSADEAS